MSDRPEGHEEDGAGDDGAAPSGGKLPVVLIVVVVVVLGLGCLAAGGAALIFVRVEAQQQAARQARIEADFHALRSALQLYKLDTGAYPARLDALWVRPADAARWNGPYVDASPADPWGRPYGYTPRPGQSPPFVLTSFGADGVVGGADEAADISSLEASGAR